MGDSHATCDSPCLDVPIEQLLKDGLQVPMEEQHVTRELKFIKPYYNLSLLVLLIDFRAVHWWREISSLAFSQVRIPASVGAIQDAATQRRSSNLSVDALCRSATRSGAQLHRPADMCCLLCDVHCCGCHSAQAGSYRHTPSGSDPFLWEEWAVQIRDPGKNRLGLGLRLVALVPFGALHELYTLSSGLDAKLVKR